MRQPLEPDAPRVQGDGGRRTSPTLLESLRASAGGEAWARFEREYAELVLAYCQRTGLQRVDAEDVWQATLLRLLRAFESFEYDPSRGRFRAFLFVVVRSAIAAMRRKHGSHSACLVEDARFDGPAAATAPQPDVHPLWEAEWRHFHLRRAFRALSTEIDERSRAVFDALLAGRGVDEVARAHAMTKAAVHKVKQRVRDRLRERIAAQLRDEDGGLAPDA